MQVKILPEEEIIRLLESNEHIFVCTPMERYTGVDASFGNCVKCGCAVFFVDTGFADVKTKICIECFAVLMAKMSDRERRELKLLQTPEQIALIKSFIRQSGR